MSLPSGRSIALSAPASSSVLEFKTATKQSFKLQFLELIRTNGCKLSDPCRMLGLLMGTF